VWCVCVVCVFVCVCLCVCVFVCVVCLCVWCVCLCVCNRQDVCRAEFSGSIAKEPNKLELHNEVNGL